MGSNPIYYPNANNESNWAKATKKERGKNRRVEKEATNEGDSDESVYTKAEEAKFSITEGGKSENVK